MNTPRLSIRWKHPVARTGAVLCLLAAATSAAAAGKRQPIPEVRDAWIQTTATELRNFVPSSGLATGRFRPTGHKGVEALCCEINGRGLLNLGTNDWVWIVSHSAHDDPNIGDVSIGVCQGGRLYKNEAHVCGKQLRLVSTNGLALPASSEQFFRLFLDEIDDKPWIPLPSDPKTPAIGAE
ncbi:MAG: hypothetical protein FJ222_03290 [Lentisphaerae bacterium]|nr:hypothetical protein [Lentisphaerota bacterium]